MRILLIFLIIFPKLALCQLSSNFISNVYFPDLLNATSNYGYTYPNYFGTNYYPSYLFATNTQTMDYLNFQNNFNNINSHLTYGETEKALLDVINLTQDSTKYVNRAVTADYQLETVTPDCNSDGKDDIAEPGFSEERRRVYTEFMGKFKNTKALEKILQTENLNPKPLKEALEFYFKNKNLFPNDDVITITDHSLKSNNKRMFVIDLKTGDVKDYYAAHGSGSDPDGVGKIQFCNKRKGSHASMDGFMRTRSMYKSQKFNYSSNGDHVDAYPSEDNALKFDGISTSCDNALDRAIYMHESEYVSNDSSIKGRSWGCTSVPVGQGKKIFNKIKEGSLYYNYVPQCRDGSYDPMKVSNKFCGAYPCP